MAVNGIVGAGIFGLPSKVFALTGAFSIMAFVVCALVAVLIILCFAEVASRFSGTGGPYLYAREAYGSAVGFEVGWLIWLARLTAFAANANLLVDYLGFFWPRATAPYWREAILFGVVGPLAAVNVVGVTNAAKVGNVLTVAKLVPMIFFLAAGFFFLDPGRFTFADRPGYGPFSESVLLLVYAFTGFEMAVIPAGEVRDPRRDLARAILTAIGVVAVLYVGIQVVCIGTLPGLAASSRPVADAADAFLGRAGASLITAGVVVSILGNLHVLILAASRLPYAMADGGELPSVLARTHPRFRTPHVAILATVAVMLALTLGGSFASQVRISAIARLLSYGATCAALIVLRRSPAAPAAGFTIPGGEIVAVAALLLSAWHLSNSTWADARDAGIAAGVGCVVYAANRMTRRLSGSDRAGRSITSPCDE